MKMKRALSIFMLVLPLVSMMAFSFNLQDAEASGTVYIRADGSIDPPDAPIHRDGDVYNMTDNITSTANGITIERDNIILDGAGYLLQGSGIYETNTNGTYIIGKENITIGNMTIQGFGTGITLDNCTRTTVVENIITDNMGGCGIHLAGSHYNRISQNQITRTHDAGIYLYPASNYNNITENVVADDYYGIYLIYCMQNRISNNSLANMWGGIDLGYSPNNTITGNTFTEAGLFISGSYKNTIEDNNVNGKPLVFLEETSDYTVEDAGQVVLVNCNNISVVNLNLSSTSYGIELCGTNNSRIADNNIAANKWNGIHLWASSNNTFERNNVTGNLYHGVHFLSSSFNTLRDNNISDNLFNFFVDGSDISQFVHDVDVSNTVDGKPVYYWINKTETTVPLGAGYVALVNCTRMTVQDLTLTKNAQAIMLAFSTNCTVTQNDLTENEYDVYLYESQNNTITGNNMTSDRYGVYLRNSSYNIVRRNKIMWTNYYGVASFYSSHNCIFENTVEAWYGVLFESSSDNLIYHNSFIGSTTHQFFVRDSVNVWDNGYPSGGNYWSDYLGSDIYSGPYQNGTGSDRIIDTPYVIDSHNQDNYPLTGPWIDVAVTEFSCSKTVLGQGYTGTVNVTIENQGRETATFNLTAYANSAVIYSEPVTLPVANQTLVFKWNTTGFGYGNYTLEAIAEPLFIEADILDNNYTCTFAVHVGVAGDVSSSTQGVYDKKYDMKDVAYLVLLFNTKPTSPNWNPNADVDNNGVVSMIDIAIAILNFNKHE